MAKEVIEQAEEVVVNYATKKFFNALRRVDREQHGKGCGCNSCKVQAVEDVNSWADFVGGEGYNESEYNRTHKFRLNRRGQIVQGNKPE